MTVQRKLVDMLIQNGLFESQATAIMELALPVLNKQAEEVNGMQEKEGEIVAVNPYKITWNAPSTDYPKGLYDIWFLSIKPVALKWIDENKPNAWCRAMFV